MDTKFLSVKPANREDQVSFGFFVSLAVCFTVINIFVPFGLFYVGLQVANFIASYLVFGGDRVTSTRKALYQIRNHRLTCNHKDTYYTGDEFYKVPSLKEVVILDGEPMPKE